MLKYTKYFTLEVIKIRNVIKPGDKLAIQCKCIKILFGVNRMTREIYFKLKYTKYLILEVIKMQTVIKPEDKFVIQWYITEV